MNRFTSLTSLCVTTLGLSLFSCSPSAPEESGASVDAPTSVTAEAGVRMTRLNWEAVSGAKYYSVYFTDDAELEPIKGEYIDLGDVTTFDHKGLENGTTYRYQVTAWDADNNESAPSEIVESTPQSGLALGCELPETTGLIGTGSVMPETAWEETYLPDGTQISFSMTDFYCAPEYEQYSSLVVILVAEWCPNCPAYMAQVAQDAQAIQEAGGLLLINVLEDNSYSPASSTTAQAMVNREIGPSVGLRVGEGSSTPSVIYNSPIWNAVPSGFLVRKDDMVVTRNQKDDQYVINWAAAAASVGNPTCTEADEEPYEINDTPASAPLIEVGGFDGGICNSGPDFFSIAIEGEWTVDLTFQNAKGDLDLYVVDENGEPLRDADGNRIGSESSDDNESVTYSGPSIIMVTGYNGALNTYHLELTAN